MDWNIEILNDRSLRNGAGVLTKDHSGTFHNEGMQSPGTNYKPENKHSQNMESTIDHELHSL